MIYICVPTYNEARTVGVLLWKIRQVMSEFPRDYRVLVADDGSTDATPEVLAPYTRVLPLTVYRNEERHGYAASTEMLLREVVRRSDYPRRDIVITLQADFTEEPEEIPTLVRRIEGGADVVTGALTMRDAHAPRAVRWTHKLLGYLVRRGRWPEGITDPLSGFRAYRVITLKKLLDERNGRPLFQGQGWAANVELLRAVVPYARRVDEAPVAIRYNRRFRESRFRPWETIRGIISMLRAGPVAEENGTETGEAVGGAGENGWEEVSTGGSVLTGTRLREGRQRRPTRGRRPSERAGRARRSASDEGARRGERAERSEGERPEARGEEARGERRPARRRRGGRGRRRPTGSGPREAETQEAKARAGSEGTPAADEGGDAGATARGEKNASRRPGGRGRRGGRRGGRRTGARAQGRPGDGSSSGPPTTD